MFGFGGQPASKFRVMGHDVEIASISSGGKILFTSDTIRAYPKTQLEGQIFEVLLTTRSGMPYFAYYLSPDYYYAVVGSAGIAAFGGPFKTEEFRTAVSQQAGLFVVQHLLKAHKIDARADITSFRHNRAHTNVLAYVPSLGDWYPIQHNDAEDEDACERKVSEVERGTAKITDVIAVHDLSPSAQDT